MPWGNVRRDEPEATDEDGGVRSSCPGYYSDRYLKNILHR